MGVAQDIAELEAVLASEGVHAGLGFLNKRAPHRFTGIYRYDGDMLRNVALVDKFSPELKAGGDVTMGDAYCALVRETAQHDALVFTDARDDVRFEHKPGSPVVSYCGVLLRTEQGDPFGTLCHYDVKRCEAPFHDVELLRAAAPLLFAQLRASGVIAA